MRCFTMSSLSVNRHAKGPFVDCLRKTALNKEVLIMDRSRYAGMSLVRRWPPFFSCISVHWDGPLLATHTTSIGVNAHCQTLRICSQFAAASFDIWRSSWTIKRFAPVHLSDCRLPRWVSVSIENTRDGCACVFSAAILFAVRIGLIFPMHLHFDTRGVSASCKYFAFACVSTSTWHLLFSASDTNFYIGTLAASIRGGDSLSYGREFDVHRSQFLLEWHDKSVLHTPQMPFVGVKFVLKTPQFWRCAWKGKKSPICPAKSLTICPGTAAYLSAMWLATAYNRNTKAACSINFTTLGN